MLTPTETDTPILPPLPPEVASARKLLVLSCSAWVFDEPAAPRVIAVPASALSNETGELRLVVGQIDNVIGRAVGQAAHVGAAAVVVGDRVASVQVALLAEVEHRHGAGRIELDVAGRDHPEQLLDELLFGAGAGRAGQLLQAGVAARLGVIGGVIQLERAVTLAGDVVGRAVGQPADRGIALRRRTSPRRPGPARCPGRGRCCWRSRRSRH